MKIDPNRRNRYKPRRKSTYKSTNDINIRPLMITNIASEENFSEYS